ncbi:MAG: hypothetical protein WBL45_03585, partial [Solirubrobacterales bacterium]
QYPNPEFGPGAILSADFAPGAIGVGDFAEESVDREAILDGTVTSADVIDAQVFLRHLPTASVGAAALVETVVVRSPPTLVRERLSDRAEVTCPGGSQLLGGGAEWDRGGREGLFVVKSAPLLPEPATFPPQGWEVVGHNTVVGSANLFAKAICLQVG